MKDRVRRNTSREINEDIDNTLRESIDYYKGKSKAEISQRIEELDSEWDIERVLETNMSAVALSGIALSVFHNRKWIILPAIVLGFFVQHAIQGWCPPLPLFRKLGYRTRKEIDKEKYALKLLRGDFDISEHANTKSSERIAQAIS
ncbi:MAG TPA: hypothetical protein VF144_19930 [Chitinophagaceae bacterium]